MKPSYEEILDLLKRNLERMRLINTRCVFALIAECPNHKLMDETAQAILKAEGGK